MEAIAARAAPASKAALPELLAALGDPGFRELLSAALPESAAWAPQELLQRFREEVAVTEVIHNFPAVPEGDVNPEDVNLRVLERAAHLPNQWELFYLQPNRTDIGTMLNWMLPAGVTEESLYGLSPFTGGVPLGLSGFGGWPASYEECVERPVYTSLNLLRTDMGVGDFGSVGLILDRAYVGNMTILSAVDTGDYEIMCNDTFSHQLCSQLSDEATCARFWLCIWKNDSGCDNFAHFGRKGVDYTLPVCDSWDGTSGTFEHFDHMILANARFWNITCADCGGGANQTIRLQWRENLALQFARTLGSWWPTPAALMREALHEHYWEANILGAPLFPHAVSLVLGEFTVLFGTPAGARLQDFCRRWGWPLAWAFGSNWNRTQGEDASYVSLLRYEANKRFLDPTLLAGSSIGYNLTVPKTAIGDFEILWLKVQAAREVSKRNVSYPYPDPSSLAEWWTEAANAMGHALQVEPLRARRCAAATRCVGLNRLGDCVCYPAQQRAQAESTVVV